MAHRLTVFGTGYLGAAHTCAAGSGRSTSRLNSPLAGLPVSWAGVHEPSPAAAPAGEAAGQAAAVA